MTITTKITDIGWFEIITKEIIILQVSAIPIFHFDKSWIRISKEMNREDYENCQRCRNPYNLGDGMYLVTSYSGNYHICANCAGELLNTNDGG